MGKDKIDLSQLSERELLILLNNKVECQTENLAKVIEDYAKLNERVVIIETRNKIISASWGIGSILITIVINILNYLKNVGQK